MLEAREWKLIAWQIPLLLLLALAVVEIDVKVSLLGFSADGVKSLREILLVLSTTLVLIFIPTSSAVLSLKEMLGAVVDHQAKGNDDLQDFLEVRYGLSDVFSIRSFASELEASTWFQTSLAIILLVSIVMMGLMLLSTAFGLHILNLIEVYKHPNFSFLASLMVIIYVVLGDVFVLGWWLISQGYQPYKTHEDAQKLHSLLKTDRKAAEKILREVAVKYHARGFIRRFLTRPKLPKLL